MTDSRLDSRGPADAGRDACGGCPVASGRREFLQRVLAAGTAALVAAVGLPGAAAALPVRLAAAHRFQCPKHKSQYQPDGEFITGRATRGMDRLGIRRDGSTVVVDLDALHKQDDDPAGWAAAVVRLA